MNIPLISRKEINVKCITTKVMYSTILATSLIFGSSANTASNDEQIVSNLVADLVTCISNFNDTRTYVQFIDSMIAKVMLHKNELTDYFKKNYPKLSVDGFLTALQSAKQATSAFSAGAALANYAPLLPKHVTYAALLSGINRRMKEDFKRS